MEHTVGVRELKTRLGAYLRDVMAGATLVVTQRGRPVAELRPIAATALTGEPALDRLVGAGLLSHGGGELTPFSPATASGGDMADDVVRGREDRL